MLEVMQRLEASEILLDMVKNRGGIMTLLPDGSIAYREDDIEISVENATRAPPVSDLISEVTGKICWLKIIRR